MTAQWPHIGTFAEEKCNKRAKTANGGLNGIGYIHGYEPSVDIQDDDDAWLRFWFQFYQHEQTKAFVLMPLWHRLGTIFS